MSKSKASAAPEPLMINDTNLSRAWARLLLGVLDGAGTEVSPLVLSVTGFGENGAVPEDSAVRHALDHLLKRKRRLKVEDVAFTIFPQRVWEMSRGDRARLFTLYRATFPRWQAMNKKANGRGLYFERMVMYGRGPCDGNQLEWILSQFSSRAGVRRSMLQATTFDPGRDHVASAQLGFPCLQQVSFEPTAAGLVVNAFYATQQIFDKAYGNYLGLAQLGAFMAHGMDMPLARLKSRFRAARLRRQGTSVRAGHSAGPAPGPRHRHGSRILRKKPPKPAAKPPRGRPPKPRVDPSIATLPFDLPVALRSSDTPVTAAPLPITLRHLAPAKVSEVYESYWRFAAERQAVFFRRAHGTARPWTDNAVLATYKFTNAYRASDRVSQYLIRHVIYRADLPSSPREVFFRILLFKLFNKIQTWELLEQSLGPITFEDYSFAGYDEVLGRAMRDGRRIYSAAYIMPPGSAFGRPAKHQNHLLLLECMMEDRLPERLAQTRTMQEGFEKLRAYPTIGDFLAYQFITDINYSEITDLSEMDFVVPGPGARDGLRKCFADPGGLNEPELIRLMADLQEQEFERLGLDFQSLWGRRLQLIDCQNLFCEVDKYARVAHPHIAGRTGRTRIKQKFEPTHVPIELFYPPKWKLNEKIRASAETSAHAACAAQAVAG
jgi:hypothetical protein